MSIDKYLRAIGPHRKKTFTICYDVFKIEFLSGSLAQASAPTSFKTSLVRFRNPPVTFYHLAYRLRLTVAVCSLILCISSSHMAMDGPLGRVKRKER